jgi:hypothetical protein
MDDKPQRAGRDKQQQQQQHDQHAGEEHDPALEAQAEVRRRVMFRKAKGRANPVSVPTSSGEALPDHVRTKMEPLVGGNLSGARVHTGGDSAHASEGLGAKAFTVGSDVHFGAGQYAPGSKEGDRLLAHELTHVVQGANTGVRRKADGSGHGDEHAAGHEVSEPNEPAEVEADAKADHAVDQLHGGDKKGGDKKGGDKKPEAAPAPVSAKYFDGARIYRKGDDKGKPAAPPSGAGKPAPAAGGGASAAPADPLDPLRQAIGAKNRTLIAQAWSKMSAADHKKVTQPDILAAFDGSPGTALNMMKAIGADFSVAAYAQKLLSIPKPEAFMGDMATVSLWDSFIKSSPKHEELTKAQRDALGGFVGPGHARAVFEKVYPTLQDATYNATFLKTTKWGDDDIQRLYHAFDGLPIAHVQASSGGFFLGTQENLDGKGFKNLGFAWQDGNKMVLPKSSSKADGGGTGHDMSGGKNSGAAVDKAGTPGGGPTQSHFLGSATHEVGHAVSNAVGGDAWATTRNGFQAVAHDAWSKALFDDAAVDKAVAADVAAKKLKKADTIASAAVRTYLTDKIQNKTTLPPKVQEGTMQSFIKKYASSQPLAAYLDTVIGTKDDYQLPATNLVGGKAYAYLRRYNGGTTCTYNADTYNKRVSWYSVSSPAEWFAENYSHYYRMEGKHPEKDVKTYFDGLDKYKWNAGGSGTLAAGGAGAEAQKDGSGAAGGGGDAQKGGAPGGQAPQDGKQADQQQGNDNNKAATANIHRMPFAW